MQRLKQLDDGHPADWADGAPLRAAKIRMPTVAAIVCNYNQKDFLEEAIASALGQTYPHMEFVVVDDCSTDGSPEVIRDILARIGDGRMRFIQHEENRGQMAAMLSGLDATTAPFVAWLDADDVWFPEYIERHIAHHLNPQANAAISTSNMTVIDAEGTLIAGADPSRSANSPLRKQDRTFPILPADFAPKKLGIDYAAPPPPTSPVLVSRNYEAWIWSPTSGMTFRRAAIEAIRPVDARKLRICADNYLARFSHLIGGTIWMAETLGHYRLHGKNNFAKHTVYGDGMQIGKAPSDVMVETDWQIVIKLLDRSSTISALLPTRKRLKALLRIARTPNVLRQLLSDRALLRRISLKYRVYLAGRYAFAKLRGQHRK